jgi:transcriptional regulator with XRE-family HTH domain
MGGTSSPRATALGAELANARAAAGMTLRQLSDLTGVSHGALSRYENGTRMPEVAVVKKICDGLGLPPGEREVLLERARGGDAGPWLAISMPEQRRQLDALIARERTALAITNVAPLVVPGLLQTSAYARAIMTRARVPAGEIETRVAVRVGRREALTREQPARLLALINEPVLRQLIGDADIMAAQLRHLVAMADWPNVDLRIVSSGVGWTPMLDGPFVICEDADGSAIVHLETRTSGLFLHESRDVDAYVEAAEQILGAALDPGESVVMIRAELAQTEAAIA